MPKVPLVQRSQVTFNCPVQTNERKEKKRKNSCANFKYIHCLFENLHDMIIKLYFIELRL